MTSDDESGRTNNPSYDRSDVALCLGVVLMSLGVATLAVSYLFPYNLARDSAGYYEASARETETAEQRAWSSFTVLWLVGLGLVAVGVVVVTLTVVYNNCCCCLRPHTAGTGDVSTRDVIGLGARTRTSNYGAADTARR